MYKSLNEMNAKEKNALMKRLIKDYKDTKARYELLLNHDFYPKMDYGKVKESSLIYNNMEVKLINYMDSKDELRSKLTYYDAIVAQLDDRSREIIVKDFLEEDNFWWASFYSKSSYYRARRKAIDGFLSYLID